MPTKQSQPPDTRLAHLPPPPVLACKAPFVIFGEGFPSQAMCARREYVQGGFDITVYLRKSSQLLQIQRHKKDSGVSSPSWPESRQARLRITTLLRV